MVIRNNEELKNFHSNTTFALGSYILCTLYENHGSENCSSPD